ncbi:unnamed protein product [Colias eurytheme]|nr:unnamed protein product [Colias eurytheme]
MDVLTRDIAMHETDNVMFRLKQQQAFPRFRSPPNQPYAGLHLPQNPSSPSYYQNANLTFVEAYGPVNDAQIKLFERNVIHSYGAQGSAVANQAGIECMHRRQIAQGSDSTPRQWRIAKSDAKQKFSIHKNARIETGGGPKPPSLDPITSQMIDMIPKEFEVDFNHFDSDGIIVDLQDNKVANEAPILETGVPGFNNVLQEVMLTPDVNNNLDAYIKTLICKDVCTRILKGIQTRLSYVEKSGTFSVATFFDPGFKTAFFFDKLAAEAAKKKVTEMVFFEINKEWATVSSSTPTVLPTAPATISDASSENASKPYNFIDIWADIDVQDVHTLESPLAIAIAEVQRYLNDKMLPKNASPNDGWRKYSFLYPNLSKLFKKHCCVLATSVP